MLTWVILPPDFDPAKKYPTLLYCEGGPQSVVSQFWSYRWNFQLMAAQRLHRRRPQPPGRAFVRTGVARPDLGRLLGPEHPRLPLGHRRRRPASRGRTRTAWAASALRTAVIRSISWPDTTTERFKAFISHCGIFDFEARCTDQTEELVLPEQRLRRPLLGQAERDGHAYLC